MGIWEEDFFPHVFPVNRYIERIGNLAHAYIYLLPDCPKLYSLLSIYHDPHFVNKLGRYYSIPFGMQTVSSMDIDDTKRRSAMIDLWYRRV